MRHESGIRPEIPLPEIRREFNKYDRGRLFIIGGSYGMAGALIMAARAALRTGAGYVDLAMPESIYPVVTGAVPEAVCSVYRENSEESIRRTLEAGLERADAAVIGCGLGKLRDSVCPAFFEACRIPAAADADALNYLASLKEPLPLGDKILLTPHEGEMARLLKTDSMTVHENRRESALKAAGMYKASVLLKGPDTLIFTPGREPAVNRTGNAGMARAGSGDVLSGMIGALLAQGMELFDAAVFGAWLHGEAGDRCREKYGIRSMLPTDMIEMIPAILKEC
ncbi:MAG: NAD(P)H-hydrate dehydratase [Lachnospiraceae bacterium]|nr:NAD(P)H-hydrate dehydratase [Lachnospiraceae bacterium]